MNILKRGAIALAVLGMAGSTAGLVAASSASAAPPVRHQINVTAVTTRTQNITPRISVINSLDYGSSTAAPGFKLVGRTTEVCVSIPHGPSPFAPEALCTWRMNAVPPTIPATSISGTAVVNGFGQVGRITSGTGADAGAFSLPLSFRSLNIAPRTAADSFTFFTP